MEFRAKRDEFLAALYWTQGIVERRNTMPILSNVLLECRSGGIYVTATDLEVGFRGKVEGEVAHEGMATANAKKLYEIVREAPADTLQLKRLENEWVEVKSGKSVFKIVGLDAREFPQFPKFDGEQLTSIPATVVREMVERTIFAVSIDETRYNLNGVFIEQSRDGKARMVATDGHRLALIEKSVGALGLSKGVILPRKGLGELRRLVEGAEDGLVSLGFKENMALVTKDNMELFMRLIEGDFPDYTKVIPKENPYVAKIDQDEFMHALRRVSILSSERYKGIKVDFKSGKVLVSASNPDLGEAVEELEVEYDGKTLSVGFNARYLLDVLAVLGAGGEVEVLLKDDVSPSIVRKGGDEEYLYVVMPMRL
jgi:DNA polymerase-3 subunit beta